VGDRALGTRGRRWALSYPGFAHPAVPPVGRLRRLGLRASGRRSAHEKNIGEQASPENSQESGWMPTKCSYNRQFSTPSGGLNLFTIMRIVNFRELAERRRSPGDVRVVNDGKSKQGFHVRYHGKSFATELNEGAVGTYVW
jgi:hypothetical protein